MGGAGRDYKFHLQGEVSVSMSSDGFMPVGQEESGITSYMVGFSVPVKVELTEDRGNLMRLDAGRCFSTEHA